MHNGIKSKTELHSMPSWNDWKIPKASQSALIIKSFLLFRQQPLWVFLNGSTTAEREQRGGGKIPPWISDSLSAALMKGTGCIIFESCCWRIFMLVSNFGRILFYLNEWQISFLNSHTLHLPIDRLRLDFFLLGDARLCNFSTWLAPIIFLPP